MNSHTKKRILWVGLIGTLFVALISFGYYATAPLDGIYDVKETRDLPFLTRIFERDLYWLTTAPSHDTAYMVRHHAKSKDPQDQEKLVIKVAYECNKPVGFVAYYMENFYIGKVLFLDVNPEFRSKKWGYRLLDYAVKKLLDQGAVKVQLVTRTNNTSAQSLYKKYGFKETECDKGFVDFEFRLSF